MTFSGDLSGISLADVFQNIGQNRISGTLRVTGRGSERFVLFQEGMVAGFSLGPNKGLPLGEHLVQRGWVDRRKLDAALVRRRKQRKLLRECLADMRVLAEEQLDAALAELVQEQVYDLLLLKEANFTFTDGPPPPRVFDTEQKAAKLRLDAGPLLIEGARRRDEWERIQKVVLGDRDLFVATDAAEAAADAELDDVAARVLPLLDGRTELTAILQQLPCSRFDVLKAITTLVLAGLARPCNGSEIVQMAQAAMAEGDDEQAIQLLTQALAVERSNQELRQRLAELLERSGRREDAAAEYVLLGYAAAQAEQPDVALQWYERAAALNPNDLMLHERRVQILADHGTPERHAAAALQLADLLLVMGLAERARTVLRQALAVEALARHMPLLEKLAEVEVALGHGEQAAQVFLEAAASCPTRDEAAQLTLLRRALAQRPSDAALAARVHDLESGQGRRRRARRRRILAGVAGGSTLCALAFVAVVEVTTAHQALHAVQQSLQQIGEGTAAATITDLQRLGSAFSWTMAGSCANHMVEGLVELEVRRIEGLLAKDEYAAAMQQLQAVYGSVQREDHHRRLAALQQRVRLEEKADQVLRRANQQVADEAALRELGALRAPELLDFYLRRLPALYPRPKAAVLRALLAMDSPRALPAIARVYLTSRDPEVTRLCAELLQGAERHRRAGREAEWCAAYAELQRFEGDPSSIARAREALHWLRGPAEAAASPGSGGEPAAVPR